MAGPCGSAFLNSLAYYLLIENLNLAEGSNHGIQTLPAHDIVFRVTRSGPKEGWPDLLGVFPSEAYARETVKAYIEWYGGELE